jgi:hypothetical protein
MAFVPSVIADRDMSTREPGLRCSLIASGDDYDLTSP